LLPELNQYKQNNAALQKQIESLMTKLNDSKRNEKDLRNTLGAAEQKCAELEDIVDQADKLAKTMQALQNTIDHLESRLEIANTERLDAEEQLSNLRDEKSPFGFPLPKTRMPSGTERSNMVCATLVENSSTCFYILVAQDFPC
jgi:chromosome segregation ATPase